MRITTGPAHHRRKKRIMKLVKGYVGGRRRLWRTAQEALLRSDAYAYRDRKNRKRTFRRLWIIRLNAACRARGMMYSRFINGLNKANIELNRKQLSEMAIADSAGFDAVFEAVSAAK